MFALVALLLQHSLLLCFSILEPFFTAVGREKVGGDE